MLQRYWSMSARLADLRATVAAASLAGDSSATGNASSTASSGDGGNSRGVRAEIGATVGTTDTTTTSKGDVGGGGGGSSSSSGSGSGTNAGVVTAQLEVAGAILSRDLEGLSEGDLLLVSERCGVRNGAMLSVFPVVACVACIVFGGREVFVGRVGFFQAGFAGREVMGSGICGVT